MENLTMGQIISAVKGKILDNNKNEDISIDSISIDSRDIKRNSLYIPIKGENFDGHLFIEDAFNKGAVMALTQDKEVQATKGILIYVEDTKRALMDLAAYYRSLFDIPVIAVTGSVGKTSTKDLIASIISAKYKVHKTSGNFNNEIGLPLTVFGLEKNHQVLIVEMGMNHFGEIHNLSLIAKPDISIITNIGVAHIENLGSQEGILKAKCEILDGMTEDGVLIVNGDDQMLGKISTPHRLITYGRSNHHLFYTDGKVTNSMNGITATYHTPTSSMEATFAALGEHMVGNALAAIAVAKQLELSDEEIQEGFKLYKPTKMRMELEHTDNNLYIINDTYNASPDSMKAALDVVCSMPNTQRRVVILGDMFEMGEYAPKLHQEVGEYIGAKQNIDLIITVGHMSKHIQKGAINQGIDSSKTLHFETQEELLPKLKDLIHSKDLILVKASRGMKLEKTVDELGKVNLNES